jgi:hypothetical protein
MAGRAAALACDGAIDNGRRVAAHHFEAATADVEFTSGRFTEVESIPRPARSRWSATRR